MADDHSQRPFQSNNLQGRTAPGADNPAAAGNDPLAELARLIGQSDPFGEFGRKGVQAAPQPAEAAAPAYAAHAPQPYEAPAPQAGYAADDMARQSFGSAPLAGSGELYQPQGPVPGYESYGNPADAGYHDGADGYDDGAYDPNAAAYAGEGDGYYDDVPPPRRRLSVLAIAGVFALAVVGTAGAFGYRAVFGSVASGPPPVIKADAKPAKIVPVKDQSAKLINDRINDPNGTQKIVSREEQPVDLNQPKPAGVLAEAQAAPAAGDMQEPALGSGVIGPDPKKIHTITIHPDQPGATNVAAAGPASADVADAMTAQPSQAPFQSAPVHGSANEPPASAPVHAEAPKPAPPPRHVETHRPEPVRHRVASASANAPLSLTPSAVASDPSPARAPTRLASRSAPPAAASGGHYAVQISSRRSQSDAQAALNRIKSRYAGVIGGQQVMVRRVDLGAKGVYYRAMVGPFISSDEATHMCSRLKAAGGSCFVQRI